MEKCTQGIKWTWKKIFTAVLGVLGIGTITSCYGVPDNYAYTIQGCVRGRDNGKELPIEGIKVTFGHFNGKTTWTDEEGFYEINLSDDFHGEFPLSFTDVDGEKNGKWKEKTETVNLSSSGYTLGRGTTILEKDE